MRSAGGSTGASVGRRTGRALYPISALPFGTPLARHPGLRATLSVPSEFTIDQTTLGLNEGIVTVTITNAGPSARRLGKVRLAFAIHRNDVESLRSAEARHLRKRRRHACARRVIHCDGEPRMLDSDRGQVCGASVRDLRYGWRRRPRRSRRPGRLCAGQPNGNAAHEAPSHPGLFALAGGGALTLPVPEGEPEDRSYKIAIVFSNATRHDLEVPPVRASLLVYRVGEETPCTGEAIVRSLPSLASGALNVLRIPVTCVRDKPGDYVIVARVAFDMRTKKSRLMRGAYESGSRPTRYDPASSVSTAKRGSELNRPLLASELGERETHR